MSTRGAYGFRIDGQDKVTYNHSDSYPECLGYDLLRELRGFDRILLPDKARAVVLVDGAVPATDEQIAECSQWRNLEVSKKQAWEWYCLLREAQGSFEPWLIGGLKYMIDSHKFLADSLMCEWAYIVNCDENVFEVYRGFNKDPGEVGRYAALRDEIGDEYCGVRLIQALPLSMLYEMPEQGIRDFIAQWEMIED